MINGLEKKRECRHIPGGIKSRQEEEDDDDFFFFGSGRWLNIKRDPFLMYVHARRSQLPLGRSSSRDTNQAGRRNEPAALPYYPLITIQRRAAILTEKISLSIYVCGIYYSFGTGWFILPRDWINEPLAGNQETYSCLGTNKARFRNRSNCCRAIRTRDLRPFKTSNTVTWLKMEKKERGGVGHFKKMYSCIQKVSLGGRPFFFNSRSAFSLVWWWTTNEYPKAVKKRKMLNHIQHEKVLAANRGQRLKDLW